MDAVLEQDKKLEQHITVMEHIVEILSDPPLPAAEESSPFDDDDDYKLSLWVKEKDIIRASGELSTLKALDPGVYVVDFNRDFGYYCQQIRTVGDDLFLFSNSVIDNLVKEIDTFWNKKDLYKTNSLVHKRGILLEGFPGTGKSSIITLLSNRIIEKGGVVFKVNGFRNLDYYVTFLRTNFRKIQPHTPIITILEDIDQYEQVEDVLLDFLDGKTQINHHIIIATSNNTEEIPDTFLRPSRLDLKLEIEFPDEQTRREYFQFKKIPTDHVETLVEKTEGFSLADLKEVFVCMYLLDYSLEEALNKVASPRDKKNYLRSPRRKAKLGL